MKFFGTKNPKMVKRVPSDGSTTDGMEYASEDDDEGITLVVTPEVFVFKPVDALWQQTISKTSIIALARSSYMKGVLQSKLALRTSPCLQLRL